MNFLRQLLLAIVLFLKFDFFSQQIKFDRIVLPTGSFSGFVGGITQDKCGYMWFATRAGLFKYNSIGKINIVPQDIGRVLLNLINNAFYAVNERRKIAGEQYEPTVTISTTSISSPLGGRGVEIKVIDNGGGIPKNIADKISQPFFTTKSAGEGTGLGFVTGRMIL